MSTEFKKFSKMLRRINLKLNLRLLLNPTLEVQENDPKTGTILVLSIKVPSVVTGEIITVVSSILLKKEHLARKQFSERVYKLLQEALIHEIHEGLEIEGQNHTEPHPNTT